VKGGRFPIFPEIMQSRRHFLRAGVTALAPFFVPVSFAAEGKTAAPLRKAVKLGMSSGAGLAERIANIKAAGFDGFEADSPTDLNLDEIKRLAAENGLVIHGVVDSIHWNTRLSDPDAAVRERGLQGLKTALKDSKHLGGDTVLLVPGAVKDPEKENFDQVWERSIAEVRKAIPLAEELGVKIAIETVWNNFITKSEQLVKYIDAFDSPWVGAYLDHSNMLKYGESPAQWVRALGSKRLLKLDIKGFSLELAKAGKDGDGFKAPIDGGSENWPELNKALNEVGYRSTGGKPGGWATAEVGGGNLERLKEIARQMDAVFAL
jgi:L-ribulose-5-phosphate 3-epimerase